MAEKGDFFNEGTKTPKSGVWAGILKASMEFHKREFIPYSAIRRKVGNGMNTRFWKDVWCGDRMLENKINVRPEIHKYPWSVFLCISGINGLKTR